MPFSEETTNLQPTGLETLSQDLVHLIVFKVGDEEYGIPINQVKEVTRTPKIAKMPNSPKFIMGVANIRGEIIAIMDLEERFNLPVLTIEEKTKHPTYTLVVEKKDHNLGIIVPDIPHSMFVTEGNIDKTPSILHESPVNEKYITGIAKSNEKLIIMLDMYKIISDEILEQIIK